MNWNRPQGRCSRRIAILLNIFIILFAVALVPAQAQTLPIAFPAPTTFSVADHCCPSTVAVATGDFNGDGKLDVITLDSGSDLNVLLGKGDGTFQVPITLISRPPISSRMPLRSAISTETTCST